MLWTRIKIIGGVVALVALVSAGWYVRSLISDKAALREELEQANDRADRNAAAAAEWRTQAQKVQGLYTFIERKEEENKAHYSGVRDDISKQLAETSDEMRNCLSLVVPDSVLDRMRQATRRANGESVGSE